MDRLLNPQTLFNRKVVPIWLRDTFGRVGSNPLYDMEGIKDLTPEVDELGKDLIFQGFSAANFFLQGNNIINYFYRIPDCSKTVTLVIQGLRDFYWTNRDRLSRVEIDNFETIMEEPIPKFRNILDYKSLEKYDNTKIVPMYQLYGKITPYDVINVSSQYFIECFNNKAPIILDLEDMNITLQISYSNYDFWDPEQDRVIDRINISKC